MDNCAICQDNNEDLIWRNDFLRVVNAKDKDYPCFTQVRLNQHLKEMTDLSPEQRNTLMTAVWCVEQAQRDVLNPDKINVAQFGNMVPHVHWHVIPRYKNDKHFPQPTWGSINPAHETSAIEAFNKQNGLKNQYHASVQNWLNKTFN